MRLSQTGNGVNLFGYQRANVLLVARPNRIFVQGLPLHILIQGTIRVTIFVLQQEEVREGRSE